MNTPRQTNDQYLFQIVPPPSWLTSPSLAATQTGLTPAAHSYSRDPAGLGSVQTELITLLCLVIALFVALGAAALFGLLRNLSSQRKELLRLLECALQARLGPPPSNGSPAESSRPEAAPTIEHRSVQPAEIPAPPSAATPAVARPVKRKGRRQFRLVLAKDLLEVVHNHITRFLQEYGAEKEAGGMLVGEYSLDESTGTATFQVRGFIEAGPKAEFSAGSILFDREYQAEELRALQSEHPTAANLGCIHRHPGSMDVCSGGDAVTDREAVEDSDTKALVFAIITINNSRQRPSSVFYRDFKIDFYLMAEETGFQYVPLSPTLADLPLLESSPAMRALVSARGPAVTYDLAVLRQLPGLGQTTLCTVDAAAGSGVLLTTSLTDSPDTLHVWVQPEGGLRLFRSKNGGGRQEWAGPWAQAEVGRHVWLSHLLLQARATLAPVAGSGHHCSGLLEDKHRLMAEVRAMQERYGPRAILRRRGDTLYWEYTVHESGRAFPIEIRYPESYPVHPPEIFSVKNLPSSPHQLGGNQLCWIDTFTGHSDWNPARDTAVVSINAAHRWFACLLVYLTKRTWPKGADH